MTMQDDNPSPKDRAIQALLKDYPMPEATADFYDQALARATREGTRRQRNRWLLTGFGSAVAAGLALWFVGTAFLTPSDIGNGIEVPAVTMTVAEPRTVNLVFAAREPMDMATLTVNLPAGLELQGFPGQREVSWQTSLASGRNLLPLKLIATSSHGGEILATLEHNDRGRTFRLLVDIG